MSLPPQPDEQFCSGKCILVILALLLLVLLLGCSGRKTVTQAAKDKVSGYARVVNWIAGKFRPE